MLRCKEKFYHWLFSRGFLREVSLHFGRSGKLTKVVGSGFTLRRIKCH